MNHLQLHVFELDLESRSYEYEFDPSMEAILADIEQNFPLPTCSSVPTTSSSVPTGTQSYVSPG